jgi:WD40 repeat protein
MHDDWVSACRSLGDTILVGSYDTKVHLWNNQGEHITSLPGHTGPVRSLAFIHSGLGENKYFWKNDFFSFVKMKVNMNL